MLGLEEKNGEFWLHSHHFSLLGCQKFYFVILFSFVLLGILFLMFCCFQINFFYFKIKYFSQKIPLKIYFKKFISSPQNQNLIFLNNMQPCLDRFAFFSVFNKNSGFEWNTNPSLWYQINRIILGQICVYQLGNWQNPYIKSFFQNSSLLSVFTQSLTLQL